MADNQDLVFEKNDKKITGTENGTKSVFQSVLEDTIQNVYDTQKRGNKGWLLKKNLKH